MWCFCLRRRKDQTHKDVEAGGFEQGDLVSDGQRGEARELLGKLNRLDDAFGGQLAELVPKTDVQRDTMLRAVALQGEDSSEWRQAFWMTYWTQCKYVHLKDQLNFVFKIHFSLEVNFLKAVLKLGKCVGDIKGIKVWILTEE